MTAKKPKARGGKRAGAGRKAADGSTDLVPVGARIRADQKPKWLRLGGSVWLRRKIDAEAIRDYAASLDAGAQPNAKPQRATAAEVNTQTTNAPGGRGSAVGAG